jgi:peptidoglycan/LPS O-acetylase OafA/YrhL
MGRRILPHLPLVTPRAACDFPAPVRPEGDPQPSAPRSFYRPELDGLRFLAFLAVYVNHTVMFSASTHHQRVSETMVRVLGTIGTSGAFGVDLFYVLSSYLITELLLRERRAKGSLDVKAFYVRRVLRIWPLYLTFLALAYGLTFVLPSEQLSTKHLVAFLFFSGNWMYMAQSVTTVAAPLWSVSVEEQFYLLWPWAVRRAPVKRIVAIAIGMMVVGMAARCGMTLAGIVEPWISKNSLTRADGIACGVLLAALLDGGLPKLTGAARGGIFVASLMLLLGVAGTFHLFEPPFSVAGVTLGWWLGAVACAGVVVSVLGASGGPVAILRSKPLVYLGRISYGLYVWHQVGLLLGNWLFPDFQTSPKHWAMRIALGFGVTVGLAAVSYRFLELPFLRLKQKRFTVVPSRPEG